MNCFNDEVIQQIVDGEVGVQLKPAIDQHIKECSICAKKVERRKIESTHFKKAMQVFDEVVPTMPEFEFPENRIVSRSKIVMRLFYAVSAACILLFGLLIFSKNEVVKIEHKMVYQQYEYEIDANKPITEQEYIINIVDPDGNVTECFY